MTRIVFPGSPRPAVPPLALLDGRERFNPGVVEQARTAREQAERAPFIPSAPVTYRRRVTLRGRIRIALAKMSDTEHAIVVAAFVGISAALAIATWAFLMKPWIR
jgi:hypothetical protein